MLHRIGEYRNANRTLVGISEGNGHMEGSDVDIQLVLNLVFGVKGGWLWTGFIWLRIRGSDGLS